MFARKNLAEDGAAPREKLEVNGRRVAVHRFQNPVSTAWLKNELSPLTHRAPSFKYAEDAREQASQRSVKKVSGRARCVPHAPVAYRILWHFSYKPKFEYMINYAAFLYRNFSRYK